MIEKLEEGRRVILAKDDALGDDLSVERLALVGRIVKIPKAWIAILKQMAQGKDNLACKSAVHL